MSFLISRKKTSEIIFKISAVSGFLWLHQRISSAFSKNATIFSYRSGFAKTPIVGLVAVSYGFHHQAVTDVDYFVKATEVGWELTLTLGGHNSELELVE